MFDPKRDEQVFVAYDGKWGRRQVGKVLQRRGFAVNVQFPLYAEKKIVTNWFVRVSPMAFGGYLRSRDRLPGDWYSVYSIGAL